jgi:GDP-4-dehydro-6-deoxy-D-mannose reductase
VVRPSPPASMLVRHDASPSRRSRGCAVRALVTGAGGFVGPHLVEHLRSCGDEVAAIGRHDGPDLLDEEGWRYLVASVAPDVVYHLAGRSSVAEAWSDPVTTFRSNAEGTLNVLLACAAAGTGRVLVVSSSDVYGKVSAEELPLTESAPLRPTTPYAASKAAAEQVAAQAWLGRGLEVIVARAFNHTGPGQDERFVAPALAARVAANEASGEDAVPVGNLTARREFTDVRDVVRAYRLLVEHGRPGEIYNVCSGRDIAIQDLADRLVDLAASHIRLEPDPALLRPVDLPVLRGDCTKLAQATGWEPRVPLDRTLADLLDDMRSRVRTGKSV